MLNSMFQAAEIGGKAQQSSKQSRKAPSARSLLQFHALYAIMTK